MLNTVLNRPGCFSCRSASPVWPRHFCKTCELQVLGRMNRTCTVFLRLSVRPANCRRSPLTGVEMPNVTTPFLFVFLFLLPHLSFQSHISFFSTARSQGGLCQNSRVASSCSCFILTLCFKASQPTARPAAEPVFFNFLFFQCDCSFVRGAAMPQWLRVCVEPCYEGMHYKKRARPLTCLG